MKNFPPSKNPLLNDFIPEATLDYHGYSELSAYDIEYELRKFIEEALLNEQKHVLIVTGKGEKVRPQVQTLLRRNKFVKHFKQAGYYNGQSGAFEVTLGK